MEGPLEHVLEHPKSPNFAMDTSGFPTFDPIDYLQYSNEPYGIAMPCT